MKRSFGIDKYNGCVFLHYWQNGERPQMLKEDYKDDDNHPYIQFINADNFVSLMKSLDAAYQCRPGAIIPYHNEGKETASEPVTVKDITKFYPDARPRDNKKEKIEDALDRWALSDRKLQCTPATQSTFLPLYAVIDARNDLYRICSMYAWTRGKASLAQAFGMDNPDRIRKLSVLSMKEGSPLADYYTDLLEKSRQNVSLKYCQQAKLLGDITPESETPLFGLVDEKSIEQAKENPPENNRLKLVTREFTLLFFNAMLSDLHLSMRLDESVACYGSGLVWKPCLISETLLSDMYRFFAERLSMDGAHSVSVCPRCNRFFEKQRATKIYCNRSCGELERREEKEA